MPPKILLLPSAKIGVLQQAPRRRWLLLGVGLFWLFVVLVGLADVSARLAKKLNLSAFDAFAPAAALDTRMPPQVLEIRIASLASAAQVAAKQTGRGALVVREAPLGSIDTLRVGDYITATNPAGKTQIFKVEALGAEAANRAGQGALVLLAGQTAVVATPAY